MATEDAGRVEEVDAGLEVDEDPGRLPVPVAGLLDVVSLLNFSFPTPFTPSPLPIFSPPPPPPPSPPPLLSRDTPKSKNGAAEPSPSFVTRETTPASDKATLFNAADVDLVKKPSTGAPALIALRQRRCFDGGRASSLTFRRVEESGRRVDDFDDAAVKGRDAASTSG